MKLAHIYHVKFRTRMILMFLLMIAGNFLYAQSISHSVIASGGQNHTDAGTGISISWTIGEPVIGTLISDDHAIILTQGFQQGSLAGDVIVIPVNFSTDVSVYPNPAKDLVTIKLDNAESGIYSLKILDLNGKLRAQNDEIMPDKLILINTEKFASGVYLLQFYQNEKLLKTVQLVKQ